MPAEVFSASCEPTADIAFRQEWFTDIMVSRRQKEQRRKIRPAPVESIEFTVSSEDSREMALIDALLEVQTDDGFKVPMWHDRQILPSSLLAGATAIPISTIGYGYESGGEAILWANPWVWEVVSVSAVAVDSLTVGALVSGWAGYGTLVMPLRAGHIIQPAASQRMFSEGQEATLAFLLS